MSNNKETPKGSMRKAECSKCGGERNCEIRGEYVSEYKDDWFWGQTVWYTLECRGCENVFVLTVSSNSENVDMNYHPDGSGDVIQTPIESVKYWPPLSKRKKPDWMSEYGIEAANVRALEIALTEIYGALDSDIRMLATIGIRTAFDIASELLGVDPSLNFGQKLNALVAGNHIGPTGKDRLETIVEAGSASAHRGWRPKASELDTMMDVLEHFIYGAFVVPARQRALNDDAAKVKVSVPAKKPRTPKAKP